ncbi:hypothetical protein, partial [Escherichia coli]|uniref:hypothetical protein n=1 Tax=Escherichia coli TaxID=562 RepID=UPI003BA116C2
MIHQGAEDGRKEMGAQAFGSGDAERSAECSGVRADALDGIARTFCLVDELLGVGQEFGAGVGESDPAAE